MSNNFKFNLLKKVQKVIGKQDYIYKKWLTRNVDDLGIYTDLYAHEIDLKGSVQPVSRETMETLGLDFSKFYIQIWTTEESKYITRTGNPDKIIFNNEEYLVESDMNWLESGGWNSFYCVRIDEDA